MASFSILNVPIAYSECGSLTVAGVEKKSSCDGEVGKGDAGTQGGLGESEERLVDVPRSFRLSYFEATLGVTGGGR